VTEGKWTGEQYQRPASLNLIRDWAKGGGLVVVEDQSSLSLKGEEPFPLFRGESKRRGVRRPFRVGVKTDSSTQKGEKEINSNKDAASPTVVDGRNRSVEAG